MKFGIFLINLIWVTSIFAEDHPVPKLETFTCVNYDKPQDVHPTHYWDGQIHLAPMISQDGKRFIGYVILHMPKGSPFFKRGFQIGDVLTEIDGRAFTPPTPKEDFSSEFKKIKSNSFKSAKIERCQKISLSY